MSPLLKTEPEAEGPVIGVADRVAGLFEHNCQACHGSGARGGMGLKLVQNPILKTKVRFGRRCYTDEVRCRRGALY